MPSSKPNQSRSVEKRVSNHESLVLLAGQSNTPLALQIAHHLKRPLFEPVSIFSDGEIRVKIPENLRRKHVFIIQSTSSPVNDHIMELVFMIDAARRASAREITVIVPYFGYARQDRKEMPRVPISASVVANMLTNAGADRIVTIDIHSEQQQGFVTQAWDNLYGSYALIPAIKAQKYKNLVVGAPDKGGMARATGYAKLLGVEDVVLVYKKRDIAVNNKSEASFMIGEVEGREVVLVDDMVDTAGTIVGAANLIKEKGAKSVSVVATHGIFSGPALERIANSAIDEMIVTDTINHREEVLKQKKIKVVSIAPLLAEAIHRVESGESISSLIL